MKNEELHWLYNQQEQDRLDAEHISGGMDLELQKLNQ
jgi:hypothetical protein